MGEHALSLLSPASSGADPASRTMPTHKLTAVLEKMRIGMIQHPSSNGGSRMIAVTICSLRGAGARGASHNGIAFSPRPGPRTTRTVQKAFIGRAEQKKEPPKMTPITALGKLAYYWEVPFLNPVGGLGLQSNSNLRARSRAKGSEYVRSCILHGFCLFGV